MLIIQNLIKILLQKKLKKLKIICKKYRVRSKIKSITHIKMLNIKILLNFKKLPVVLEMCQDMGKKIMIFILKTNRKQNTYYYIKNFQILQKTI